MRRKTPSRIFPLLVWAIPAAAAGEDVLGTAALLRGALSLLLVLGLIALCAWLLRRLAGSRLNRSGPLQLLAMLPLSQRERVALVEVDGRRLLLGVAPGQVSLLRDCGESTAPASPSTPPGDIPVDGAR